MSRNEINDMVNSVEKERDDILGELAKYKKKRDEFRDELNAHAKKLEEMSPRSSLQDIDKLRVEMGLPSLFEMGTKSTAAEGLAAEVLRQHGSGMSKGDCASEAHQDGLPQYGLGVSAGGP